MYFLRTYAPLHYWIRVICSRPNILVLKMFIFKQSSSLAWVERVLNALFLQNHSSQITGLVIGGLSVFTRPRVFNMSWQLIRELRIVHEEYIWLLCLFYQCSAWFWRAVVACLFWPWRIWWVWWYFIHCYRSFWYRIWLLVWVITRSRCSCSILHSFESLLLTGKWWMAC